MIRASIASFILLLATEQASAQIFYQPVQYQFGERTKCYYGGRDARVFEQALRDNHDISDEPERVYSDAIAFQNARYFGYTAADASNDAYANAPTYFRKADLLNAAVRSADDSCWIVPAMAQPIYIMQNAPTTRPAVPVLILPNRLMRPPVSDHAKLVANR